MAHGDDGFLKRLLETFRLEADEHLSEMSAALAEMRTNDDRAEQLACTERIFRAAHSLKGAAQAVERDDIATLCQSLESLFAALKEGRIEPSGELGASVAEALDLLATMCEEETVTPKTAARVALGGRLDAIARGTSPVLSREVEAEPSEEAVGPTASRTDEVAARDPTRPSSAVAAESARSTVEHLPGFASTVRCSAEKLDSAVRLADELLGSRLAARGHAAEVRSLKASFDAWVRSRRTVAPLLRALGQTFDSEPPDIEAQKFWRTLRDSLQRDSEFVKGVAAQLDALSKRIEHDHRALANTSEGLQEKLHELQLLPFSALVESFPRYARALAAERSKQVQVVVEGGEVEIDRRVLDQLRDPLVHILRNCVDHGIEAPSERIGSGKPAQGRITFTARQAPGATIEIAVSDDGAGIDTDALAAVAGRPGGASPSEQVGVVQAGSALELVFRSGVTTSPIVTDVSGRGLGLAIVREKVERLGGMVEVESRRGAGTRFRMVLPLTLATYRGVVVRAGGGSFAVPVANVERVLRVARDDIRTVEQRPTIEIAGQALSLVGLGDALGLARHAKRETWVQVLVLVFAATRVAFQVDEVVGEQELLVKPLGPQLARVRNISGTGVLGPGELVPVLSVADLMKAAALASAETHSETEETKERKNRILVAEDSITSRTLLKNILESADYRVETAVDGQAALTALRSGAFDLLVSDVEMPRMDGFELTSRIRAEPRLAELPVVLVTALGSREQRERGVEVGANAYLVKSSFEQSNLLATVRRLL